MTTPATRPSRMPLGKCLALAGGLGSTTAQASFLSGEALDTAANAISWVAIVVVPVVVIAAFWLVHILPEKIAEKRRHPQAKAIQALCLLSLLFGGLLWPLAWLWAYSKPVLYKMAYGTDVADEAHGDESSSTDTTASSTASDPARIREDIASLREQLASLEAKVGREARD